MGVDAIKEAVRRALRRKRDGGFRDPAALTERVE